MKETILIIMFLSIVFVFIFIHSSEVSFQESFNGEQYLVRNLEDKDKAADMLYTIKTRLKKLIDYIDKDCNNNETERAKFINQYNKTIMNKFNYILFRESTDNSKFTSYSINKGEEIVFCLRSIPDNKLHDINELMYVAIHEIAHVGCPEIGHTDLFKKINIELLKYAIDCNVYIYKNYNSLPEQYCGIQLANNILTQ
tara:strand:- start:89 stop:682 length:594 start_codon:yes stop_codon:yes gene_type:complete